MFFTYYPCLDSIKKKPPEIATNLRLTSFRLNDYRAALILNITRQTLKMRHFLYFVFSRDVIFLYLFITGCQHLNITIYFLNYKRNKLKNNYFYT